MDFPHAGLPNVRLEFRPPPPRQCRVPCCELVAPLFTPEKIQFALHSSKKYISGPFAARTLYPVFKQNINPKILWNSVHNRSPGSADLECANNEFGKPISCTGNDGVKVTWVYEDTVRRKIQIKNQYFEMIWVFKDQSVMASPQNETFVLNKPEEYQLIQIKLFLVANLFRSVYNHN